MKSLRYLVSVSALLFLTAASAVSQDLRVVTINVWAGLDYKGSLKMGEYQDPEVRALRTQILVEQLRRIDADVIAVNEANKLPRYARQLAGDLNCDQVYHVGLGGLRAGPVGLPLNLREGDVILARGSLQLKGVGRKQLSGGPVGNFFTCHFADATQVIGGRIVVADREVYVFNTHWHASPFPTEDYFEKLADRRDYDAWAADGASTLQERAAQKVREILEAHQPEPLSDEVKEGIQSILEAAASRSA